MYKFIFFILVFSSNIYAAEITFKIYDKSIKIDLKNTSSKNINDITNDLNNIFLLVKEKNLNVVEFVFEGQIPIRNLTINNLENVKILFNKISFFLTDQNSKPKHGIFFQSNRHIEFDNLKVISRGGYETGRSRLLKFDNCSNIKGKSIILEYKKQHLPRDKNPKKPLWQVSNNDRAFMISKSKNISFGYIEIKKADMAMRIYDSSHIEINNLNIESYRQGILIQGGEYITINSGKITGMTSSFVDVMQKKYNSWGKDTAGNNAVLCTNRHAKAYRNMHHIIIRNFHISDSGEHAIRLAGSKVNRRSIVLENIDIRNSGAAGIKVLGGKQSYLENSKIKNITIHDCLTDEKENIYLTDKEYKIEGSYLYNLKHDWPEQYNNIVKFISISGNLNKFTKHKIIHKYKRKITIEPPLNQSQYMGTDLRVSWNTETKISHGMMLYKIKNSLISNISISPMSQIYAADDGIQFYDATNIKLSNINILSPKKAGISFRPIVASQYKKNNNIFIDKLTIDGCKIGINMAKDSTIVSNLFLEDYLIRNCDSKGIYLQSIDNNKKVLGQIEPF